MGGNWYYGTGTYNITASSTHGTGNSYYSSGWLGNKPDLALSGSVNKAVPLMGHIQTVHGVPWSAGYDSGEGSGNYWITIDTLQNVILYQSPAVASGSSFKVFPNIHYPPFSKVVFHADTGGTHALLCGVITDI